MESFNELCLKWWDGFYSSFQTSCTMTCVSETGIIDMKHGEKSILLGIGGTETSDLFDSCGIPDVDVIKFNNVLCRIEILCLPKIILMYEQYKSSLHLESKESGLIIDSFQIVQDGSCQVDSCSSYSDSMGRSDQSVKHLEIISTGNGLHLQQTPEAPMSTDVQKTTAQAIDASQISKPVENKSGSVVLKVLASGSGKGETSERVNVEKQDKNSGESVKSDFSGVCNGHQLSNIKHNRENDKGMYSVTIENSELTNENSVEHGKYIQPECQPVPKKVKIKEEADEDNSSGTSSQQNCVNQIRRSSRQIRVSARFADDREVIRKLIKPEPREAKESEPSLDIPFICSVCKAGFTDPSVLRIHWESHKQSSTNCQPFYCHKCQLSFPTHQRVRVHRCSLSNQNRTRDPTSSKETLKFDRNDNAKNSNNVDDFVRQWNGVGGHGDNGEKSDYEKNLLTCRAHTCDICSLSFQTLQLLKAHSKTHGNKPYKCTDCGKQFHQKKAFLFHKTKNHDHAKLQGELGPKPSHESEDAEKHLQTRSGKKSFFCEICGKGFSGQHSWLNHRRMHDRENEFQCQQCWKCFQDKRSLEAHHSVHTGEKPHVCEMCGKRFRIARGLINHSRLHDKDARFKCDQCPKTFIEKRGLAAHKLSHSGIKPFSCDICGKTFRRELGLFNHSRIHDNSKAIKCEVCQKSFVDKWGMLKHMSIHTGEKPFTCEVCGKSFRIKKGLENHFKLHNKDLQYKCELCPRTFVEKRKLDIHVRAHRGEKAYVCDQCGQRFINSMTLKVHKRRHTGEKPYKCSFCDKAFNQQGTLIAHERYHKGEKPYVCEVCGEGFVTKSHLTIHRRKHSNDRPYQCELCDYAAFTYSILRTHKLKHSTAKPFKCNLCTAAFKRPHHLEVHMRTHLGTEKLFRCQYCDETFDCSKKFSAHLAIHDIIVVTQNPTSDAIFSAQVPGEVAYDIVLLS